MEKSLLRSRIVSHLVKKHALFKPQYTLELYKLPNTGFCPQPEQPTSQNPSHFLKSILLLSSHLCISRPSADTFESTEEPDAFIYRVHASFILNIAYNLPSQ